MLRDLDSLSPHTTPDHKSTMDSDGNDYGPRERILQLGEARLSDAECLALILRTGNRGLSVHQLAQRMLEQFGGLTPLARAEVRELARAGVGAVRAAALGAAFGLARRLTEAKFRPGVALRGGGDVARVIHEACRGERRERFFAVLLDARHRLQRVQVISIGGLHAAPVHPREVFGAAVREGAAAIVIAHNHPSGDPSPSEDDRQVTERLRRAGEVIGIEVLDHVVVGGERYFSFAEGLERPLPIS